MSSPSSAALVKPLESPGVSTSPRLFRSPGQRTLLLCLLLTATVLVAYDPIIHNGFLNYDDDNYITNNIHVRAGLTWPTVKWAFTTYSHGNWNPLSWLSHALDCELFGLNPLGHHYMSVLLQAANAVLLFLLLQRATGFCWRSLMVAALFALHPVNVESVAWAAERKNVLSMLFFLLALHAYVWYTRKPALLRYATLFFLFALGLLSKSQIITLPFLLWLWDYWPLCRIFPRASSDTHVGTSSRLWRGWLVLEKAPLLLLCAASAVLTTRAGKAGGAVKPLSQYSLVLRLENAAISYVRYLGDAFWPSKLVALYPHPTHLFPAWQVGAAVLVLMLVTAWVLYARDRRYLAVGWFWFLGSFVPMIELIQVGPQARADRFAYIPYVGLFLMLTWLVADYAEAHKLPPGWLAIPAVSCLLALGTLTYRQVSYWHDIPSFWLRTLALTHDNYIAHDMLGLFLTSQGQTEEAAAHFRAALAIRPDDVPANLNLGAYEQDRGNLAAAIDYYEMVARGAAKVDNAAGVAVRALAYYNLGSIYRQTGEPMQAKQYFEMASQVDPDQPMPMIELGLIAQSNQNLPEAVRQYSHALAVEPTDVGYLLLAQALQHEGRADEAKAIYERVANSPNLPEAQKEAESLLSGK